jgi:hypothetical protein
MESDSFHVECLKFALEKVTCNLKGRGLVTKPIQGEVKVLLRGAAITNTMDRGLVQDKNRLMQEEYLVLTKHGLKTFIEIPLNIKLDDTFHMLAEFRDLQFKHKDVPKIDTSTLWESGMEAIRVQRNEIIPVWHQFMNDGSMIQSGKARREFLEMFNTTMIAIQDGKVGNKKASKKLKGRLSVFCSLTNAMISFFCRLGEEVPIDCSASSTELVLQAADVEELGGSAYKSPNSEAWPEGPEDGTLAKSEEGACSVDDGVAEVVRPVSDARFFKGILFFFAITIAEGSHAVTWAQFCPGKPKVIDVSTDGSCAEKSPEGIAALNTRESVSTLTERKKRHSTDSVVQQQVEQRAKFAKQGDDLVDVLKTLQDSVDKNHARRLAADARKLAADARKLVMNDMLIAKEKFAMLEKRLAMEKTALSESVDPEEKIDIAQKIKTIQKDMREFTS